ncbi:methionyl-tRNA formyltransferase [Telmatospirillum sp. J64-1]|uniref:methionyl-tRNA formyltransferase n=1 Tax=Telmatospirillum sp. J64-1 TaxID=2502183 RepID=UPI00115DE652|nr:methionyl-tRNA formyltransferase [Telmatospirillum sp. J64-1]
MRLVFMGTPDFSVSILAALLDAGHEVACVYSQPPRPAGRGHKERPTPVHAFAEARGIEVRTPKSLRSEEEQRLFAAIGADAAVVAAYGLILPKPILDAPRLGCLNVHASLLPRWRGAAPIQRAIMAGDEETGCTIMQMDVGLDTGDMLLKESLPITDETTAAELHDALAAQGARLIVEALDRLARNALPPETQPEEGVSYAAKIDKAEARIDWSRPARLLARHINGLSPFPGAWFEYQGERFKVLRAIPEAGGGTPGTVLDDKLLVAAGEGAVRLLQIQRAGGKPLDAETFLRGFPLAEGTSLASSCPATN